MDKIIKQPVFELEIPNKGDIIRLVKDIYSIDYIDDYEYVVVKVIQKDVYKGNVNQVYLKLKNTTTKQVKQVSLINSHVKWIIIK